MSCVLPCSSPHALQLSPHANDQLGVRRIVGRGSAICLVCTLLCSLAPFALRLTALRLAAVCKHLTLSQLRTRHIQALRYACGMLH